ncbi:MAG: hypothetical protein QNJ67_05205 [Kiloniellales bacterium]|nr:hypothetical protein [Kiloniellales bacterium]
MRLTTKPFAVLWLVIAGLGLSACELELPEDDYPPLRFTEMKPIKLDVASVEVQTTFLPKSEEPRVELLFPHRPDQAAANWGRDRLVAAGDSGRARFVVIDAAVTEEDLETSGGVSGAFTTEQAERYTATLGIDIEILTNLGDVVATVSVKTTRSITVGEDASIRDREKVWYELTKKLMDDANRQLEAAMKKGIASFLVG